jgi:membrane associated rhomboid family serine protease
MTPWVIRIIAVTVAMFFVTQGSPQLANALVFDPQIAITRPWTLVTYMFLHAGLGHLFFNMLSLFVFGPPLERRLGGRRFLTLYFVGGITGAVLSFATSNPIIGASAGVFGVSLGFARYWPNAVVLLWGILPVRAWLLVGIMTVLAMLGAGGINIGQSNVAHLAHLGGFLGGWIYLKLIEARSGAAAFRQVAAPNANGVTMNDVERWRGVQLDALHPVNREEFERVLAKIDRDGVTSLTGDERAFLDRFAKVN